MWLWPTTSTSYSNSYPSKPWEQKVGRTNSNWHMFDVKWYKDLWSFYCSFLVKLACCSPAPGWCFHCKTKQQMLCTSSILACFGCAFVMCWSNSLLLQWSLTQPFILLFVWNLLMYGIKPGLSSICTGAWSLCTKTPGEFLPLKLEDLFFCIRCRKERVCVLLICLNKWLKYLALVWGWLCCF